MGGTLAWTLRLPDGTEHRMQRWTNIFPEITCDAAFLAGDPVALDAALSEWRRMHADWDRHGPDGPFALPMTPVYAPYPFGLRPAEYGIIVTDFASRTIVSCQGYTALAQMRVERWMRTGVPDSLAWVFHPDAAAAQAALDALHAAHRDGRILGLRCPETGASRPPPQGGLEAILDAALGIDPIGRIDIALPHDWTVVDMPDHSRAGRARALAEIDRLGVSLSSEERADFDAWIAEA